MSKKQRKQKRFARKTAKTLAKRLNLQGHEAVFEAALSKEKEPVSSDDDDVESDFGNKLISKRLRYITVQCIFEPLNAHSSRKNVIYRLVRCLHSEKKIDHALPQKVRKHMPAFNGRLIYGTVLQVTMFCYLKLVKEHEKLSKIDDKNSYKKLWDSSFDVISMLRQFHIDLCVVGDGAEEAYSDHVRTILLSKLEDASKSYVDLYQVNPYFYQTAKEHVKNIEFRARRNRDRKNNQNSNSKKNGKKGICRYWQAGSCTRTKCEFEHKCFYCGDSGHGMCNCDAFLNKANLTQKSTKKSK